MFSFPKMPRFSKFFDNAFKMMDQSFEEMDKGFAEMSKEMDENHRKLNEELGTLDRMASGESKETVTEERRPDGTVIITRTILRKS